MLFQPYHMYHHYRLLGVSWSKVRQVLKLTGGCARQVSQSPHITADQLLEEGRGDRSLVDCSKAAVRDCETFSVIPNFVSLEEEQNLLQDINRTLRGKRYQFDHWDGAIEGYRETEKSQWLEINQPLVERLKRVTSSAVKGKSLTLLAAVHVLDLAEDGHIKPHIDSVKFCGEVIAGVSLLSQSVMRLEHEEDEEKWICALLPRHSLYIMRGVTRYKYTHAIPPSEQSLFKGEHITKERRVSVICRTLPVHVDD